MDVNGDKAIQFDEYREWAGRAPECLRFMGDLYAKIAKIKVATGGETGASPSIDLRSLGSVDARKSGMITAQHLPGSDGVAASRATRKLSFTSPAIHRDARNLVLPED